MVFSNNRNAQSTHHNRLNLRDTSAEPSNIFGDSNVPSVATRGSVGSRRDEEEFDHDLNDR